MFQNEHRIDGVYSRNNLPDKIKDGECVINLDEHSDIATHLIVLYALNNIFNYFDSFGVKHIPKEIKKLIKNKNIRANIEYDWVLCGYFYIGFIGFMLKGKI